MISSAATRVPTQRASTATRVASRVRSRRHAEASCGGGAQGGGSGDDLDKERCRRLRSRFARIAKEEARYTKSRADGIVRSHKELAATVKNAPQEFRAVIDELKNVWSEIYDAGDEDSFEDGEPTAARHRDNKAAERAGDE